VKEVGRELGCSQRTLERHILADVGVSPKTLQRIVRFRDYFRRLRLGESGSRAAVNAGYYDQSHANRDFRAFTGASPRTQLSSSEEGKLSGVFLVGDDVENRPALSSKSDFS